MLRHIHHIKYRLFVLLFLSCAAGSMAMAQQMTPVSGPSGSTVIKIDNRETLVKFLHLKVYEAAAGDLSSCAGDQDCLRNAKGIQYWLCAANICGGKDTSKEAITCFPEVSSKYSIHDQEQLSTLICPVIQSPDTETRQALLSHMPGSSQDDLVEYGAYLMALKGSAASCEGYIKNYIGAYGPQWKYDWYRALSGCRILAHLRTRQQEEKDFYTWFGVVKGSGNCSGIENNEMRQICATPNATSPVPTIPTND